MKPCLYFSLLYCVLSVLLKCASAELYEGSECTNENQKGVCTLEPACPVAGKAIDTVGYHNYTNCGFEKDIEILCCPTTEVRSADPEIKIRKSESACDKYHKAAPVGIGFQISDGDDAKPGEFPHVAALGLYSNKSYHFTCGATLISDKYLVTAAHCIRSRVGEPRIVRMGTIKVPRSIENMDLRYDYKIKNYTVHEGYIRRKSNDIALIELQQSVTFNEFVRPACLYTKEDVVKDFLITGWGAVNASGAKATTLQKAKVSYVSNQECREKYKLAYNATVNDNHLCAMDSSSDTCDGDSGGPLQMRNTKVPVLVGVTSIGGSICGITTLPTIYTKIYKYLDWIERIVWP